MPPGGSSSLLTAAGLVYNVKKPKATVYFTDRQLVPNQSLRLTHRQWHIQEPP
jgi:hypothetical protein